jgi:hypothetical protein
MHLYDPETGRMACGATEEEGRNSMRWTDELKAIWDDMMAQDVPPVEAAAFFAQHGSAFRCDQGMLQMVKRKKPL